MARKILVYLVFFSSWMFASPPLLQMGDIPRAMERLFQLHIENRELSATLVRRAFKIYLEQFDPEKCYLLEAEVLPYLNLSERKAKEVISRLERQDFSDFIVLNQMVQRAIVRSQALRSSIIQELKHEEFGPEVFTPLSARSSFAKTDRELFERQKSRMARFYQFHKARSSLDTGERKEKVFTLFERRVRRIENNYLFLISEQMQMPIERIEHFLSLRIIKAFAKSLDTHTAFFSPEEAHDMRMSLEKQFEGIGVVLSESVDGVVIAELIKGSPAEQSGQIRINDILVEINGQSTRQASFEEVLEMLKSSSKEEIVLGLKRLEPVRKKEEVFHVPLTKRAIVMSEQRIQGGYEECDGGVIGKIALHSFYESSNGVTSERDIKELIRQFQQKGELKGLVLDLRENSGGFLSQAVKVAGLFVSNGVIVISKYGKGEVHYLRNLAGRSFFNRPLVVLTSKMSASASEIVAQALQDYGVALVVGDERTFGKGSIQYQTVTDERADLFFKVTIGRYYTVSGKSTQIHGVQADIIVPTQYAPYQIGECYLEYPLPPDKVASAYHDPLSDLDERTRLVFEARYLPHLQRAVPFWKRMLPELRRNSTERLSKNPEFQSFLEKQKALTRRLKALPVNTIDEPLSIHLDDLQMQEAVRIVRDMIRMEMRQASSQSDVGSLEDGEGLEAS